MPADVDPTAETAEPAEPAEQVEPVFAEPDLPGVEDVIGRVQAEYGRFTARTDLLIGGILAVRAGGRVPTHHPLVPEWVADGLLDDATPGVDIVPEILT